MKALSIFLNTASGRARFALWFGFAFNLLYALFGLVTGIFYRSSWFGAVAIYYILLCSIKLFIIKTDLAYKESSRSFKASKKALKNYRACGYLLALLNLSIVGIVLLIVLGDKAARYSGIVLYVMGGYTVARLIISAFNLKMLPTTDDPFLTTSKCLGISVTFMSVFSFTTALLDRFCGNISLRRIVNTTLGLAVCASVLIVAGYLIFKNRAFLARSKQ